MEPHEERHMPPITARLFLFLMVLTALPPLPAQEPAPTMAEGSAAFSADLLGQLGGDDNLIFSPLSIREALAMTYRGAEGDTAAQIADVMAYRGSAEEVGRFFAKLNARLVEAASGEAGPGGAEPSELQIVNRLWGQEKYGFLDRFLASLKDDFGAGLQETDFAADPEACRRMINEWVEKETRGKVVELLKPDHVDRATALVLTNAVYFKAAWQTPFSKRATKTEPFHGSGGGTPVPLMRRTGRHGYFADESMQAISIPYRGGDLAMDVFLPRSRDGLADLRDRLTPSELRAWFARLDSETAQVDLQLPRFEIDFHVSMKKALAAMGMTIPFSPGADFSGMTGQRDLFVSEVVHGAFIAVDETGTEAAAATAVIMKRGGLPRKPEAVFRADHPFVYVIRHRETGTVLFMGQLVNPGA